MKQFGGALVCVAAVFATSTSAKAGAAEAKVEKKTDYKPKPVGYIESFFLNDESNVSDKALNQFKVRRARIGLTGNVHKWISYNIAGAFEGAFKKALTAASITNPGTTAETLSTTSGEIDSNARLWNAFIDFKPLPLLNLRVGQFKYPFTIEGLEATPDRAPVLRAEAINAIAGKLVSKGTGFRDIGAQVSGTWEGPIKVSYALGLFNGSGINTSDNNVRKDVVARLDISPIEGLTLGGSFYKGWVADRGTADVDEFGFGVHVEYRNKSLGLHLRGEYVQAKYDVPASGTTAASQTEPWGWYLQAGYAMPFHEPLEILVRYDLYDANMNKAKSRLHTVTAGLRYVIIGKTRVALNYLTRTADENVTTAQESVATKVNTVGNMLLLQLLAAY